MEKFSYAASLRGIMYACVAHATKGSEQVSFARNVEVAFGSVVRQLEAMPAATYHPFRAASLCFFAHRAFHAGWGPLGGHGRAVVELLDTGYGSTSRSRKRAKRAHKHS